MGRIKQQSSSPGTSADEIPERERLQNNLVTDLKIEDSTARQQAEVNEALKREYEHQLETLRKERAALQFEVQQLQQRLNTIELERDVKSRLLQQQTGRISRLHRELAASSTHAEQIKILPQSMSRYVAALLRIARRMFTRIMSSRRW